MALQKKIFILNRHKKKDQIKEVLKVKINGK